MNRWQAKGIDIVDATLVKWIWTVNFQLWDEEQDWPTRGISV
jgi:hypothetical protein